MIIYTKGPFVAALWESDCGRRWDSPGEGQNFVLSRQGASPMGYNIKVPRNTAVAGYKSV